MKEKTAGAKVLVPALAILAVIAFAAAVLFQSQGSSGDEIEKIKATTNLEERTAQYTALIERVGPEQAQEALLTSGLPFDGETHLLNHVSGDWLYEHEGHAGLLKCRDYFLSSCYHGFILHAIGSEGFGVVDSIMDECRKAGSAVMSQCAHAMGHGFLAWTGYANLTGALKTCDTAAAGISDFPLFNCHDGVFMENIWGTHSGKPSPFRWVNSSDAVYPCNDPRIEYRYVSACWSNQPSLMYRYFNGDVGRIGQECLKIADAGHRSTCFNGLARQIHPVTRGSIDAVFDLCGRMPPDWINYCVNTIAVSDFSVGGRDLPFRICERASDKTGCYGGLFNTMSYYKSEYEALCQKVEPDWREQCLSRA